MNKLIFFFLFTIICLGQTSKRKLVWEENFNVNSLDEKVWNYELGDGCPDLCGWGNNERQIYTNQNHSIKDGNLLIEAKKTSSNIVAIFWSQVRITNVNIEWITVVNQRL